MTAAIEVVAIRRLDGKSTVKAFCDIRCGGLILKGCKIVQQENQKAWLAMPRIKTHRAWQNIIEITSQDLKRRLTEAALAAWEGQQQEVIPPPVRGGRQSHDPLEESADAWSKRQRGPDSEPGF